jgi:hypothetical protein
MGKPFGEASRRTFGRIGTLVPFPCWNSLGVMSSDTLKFSKQPPSEALKGGLPVSVLQLSGKLSVHFIIKKRPKLCQGAWLGNPSSFGCEIFISLAVNL